MKTCSNNYAWRNYYYINWSCDIDISTHVWSNGNVASVVLIRAGFMFVITFTNGTRNTLPFFIRPLQPNEEIYR